MNDQPSRKFFDVAAPGRVGPSSTSRPVITRPGPANPDPFLHERPANPIQAKPEPAPPVPETAADAPVSTQEVDPIGLLIQADAYQPLKPTKGNGQRVAVIMLLILLVILTIVSYFMVSAMI